VLNLLFFSPVEPGNLGPSLATSLNTFHYVSHDKKSIEHAPNQFLTTVEILKPNTYTEYDTLRLRHEVEKSSSKVNFFPLLFRQLYRSCFVPLVAVLPPE